MKEALVKRDLGSNGDDSREGHIYAYRLEGTVTTYNEAKCEKGLAVDDVASHVTTVLASTHEAFIALNIPPEGLLATDEEEAHSG